MLKPLGVFSADPRPDWAQFALLEDYENFEAAAEDSARTGIKWVLGIYSPAHATPLAPYLPALVARLHESGVLPHVVGVCYREEWYSGWKRGEYAIPGLNGANPQHWMTGARAIAWWVSEQHKAIKAALNLPIVWIDTFVNDDPTFGGAYYQPVPWGVDVLAIETYVPARGSWAADVEPFLQHAVSTRHEQIALVIQGFKADGDPQWGIGPTPDGNAGVSRWLAHPRVISGWVFDWASRPGLIGVADLPNRGKCEAAVGVL